MLVYLLKLGLVERASRTVLEETWQELAGPIKQEVALTLVPLLKLLALKQRRLLELRELFLRELGLTAAVLAVMFRR